MSARRCALESLTEWEETSTYADEILAAKAARFRLSGPDRALAQEILYGTIRNLFLLDGLIDELRRGSVKPSTRDLLRIGLFQLFCSGIAEHAAVNETVNLARKHERGLVNAILRNALRQKADLEKKIESWPLEDRYSHPGDLIDRWIEQFGDENTEALLEWNNTPPDNFARINRLAPEEQRNRVTSAIEQASLSAANGAQKAPLSFVGPDYPDFFRFEGAPDAEWIETGLIYVQDPSTSLACRLLAPRSGESILDACCAPGGKTSLLARMMGNHSTLVGADSSPARLERTRENLARLGIPEIDLRHVDWIAITDEELESLPRFDAILVDAPCSNSGVMRRRVDVRWRLQEGGFGCHASFQKDLLQSVARVLTPGGRIVYSTCSLDREENEAVVESTGWAIEEVVTSTPWQDGHDGAFAALLRP